LQIQIIATSVETKPTAKGSYQQLEVTYKNLTYQGKVESKKLMSFGANAAAFKTLSNAPAGSQWEVTVVKNAQGYNDWPTVVAASNDAAPVAAAAGALPKTQPGQTRSTYETPEERAQRQVYIIRQSSVSSALTLHSMGAKNPAKLEEVLDTAQKICDFVLGVKDPGPSGFADLPDFDIPQVE
jgi:hypothetical protein